jgi:hypothetical protein
LRSRSRIATELSDGQLDILAVSAVSAASGAGFHDVLDRWAAALSNQRADNCEVYDG